MPGKVSRGSRPVRGVFGSLERSIFDCLDRGIIALDGEGEILDANSHAQQAFEMAGGLRKRGGRLVLPDAAHHRRFIALLEAGRNGHDGPASMAVAIRPNGDQSGFWLVVSLLPEMRRGASAVAVVYGSSQHAPISTPVLQELYALTPAQAEVACRLFQGLGIEEVAEALEVSANTVRTHLKHVFTKCGVQSQADLMQLLALGPRCF